MGEKRFILEGKMRKVGSIVFSTQYTHAHTTLTASTRLPALPCDNKLESFPSSEGTVSDTGRGL